MRAHYLLAAMLPCAALAQTPAASEGTLTLPSYRLQSGETITNLRLHYLLIGQPRRNAQGQIENAAILLHGTTGSAKAFTTPEMAAALYGPGQPLDTTRYLLVIPDGIGAGGSTKPSDGACGGFPAYGYRDQVESTHVLMNQLGVLHAKLVLGTSMGGMQTWLWAERFPNDADAFVAVASTPAPVSGRNLLWREAVMQAITTDPDWHGGHPDSAHPPRSWAMTAAPLFDIMTSDVARLQPQIPDRRTAPQVVQTLVGKELQTASPCDVLYQFASSFDYQPAQDLARITAPFLSINFADDLLNPPEQLHIPHAPNVHALMVTDPSLLYGHNTLRYPAGWSAGLGAFLARDVAR